MDKLLNSRDEINKIDREMAELFEKRMEAVKSVCEYKVQKGLPVEDFQREKAVIEKNSEYILSDDIRDYYVSFIKNTMEVSRKYQHKLMEGMKVAYCGVEGAFAQIAASRIFPDAQLAAYGDFLSAYEAVENGECDCAVLPIENSYAGDVGQVIDILLEGSLYINGTYGLGIVHNLIGTPDAEISDIKTVISHPQALSQCHKYIKEHGFIKQTFENTAMAGQYVAQKNDKTVAAIGSKKTAELYGLKIIDHDINASDRNTTRFAVLSRSKNISSDHKNDHFIMMFTVADETGSIAKAINVISNNGFNMQVLRSRPLKDISWQYYFFVEAIGDIYSDKGQKMFSELSKYCERLKLAGSFRDTKELSE
jgi:chorismate mutase/prephenate dehydratase